MAVSKKNVVGVREGIEGKLIDLVRRNNSQNFSLEIIYNNGGWKVALHDEEAADHDENAADGPAVGEGDSFRDAWSNQTPAYNDKEYNAEDLRDLVLAREFLTGHHSAGNHGLPKKAYLKGSVEIEARKALLRLLRNGKPLDSSLCRWLAALFDPARETSPYSSFDNTPMERRLVFVGRRGRRRQSIRKLEIAIQFRQAMEAEKKRSKPRPRKQILFEIAKRAGVTPRTLETDLAHLQEILGR
jgi:hypothetical protein